MVALVVLRSLVIDYLPRQLLPQWVHRANLGRCPLNCDEAQAESSVDEVATCDLVTSTADEALEPALSDGDGASVSKLPRLETSLASDDSVDLVEGPHSVGTCASKFCCGVRRLGELSRSVQAFCDEPIVDFARALQLAEAIFSRECE